MPLETFEIIKNVVVKAEPLTPEAFSSFGGVISADHQLDNVKKSSANYGTAIKLHKVAPIINDYSSCPSGKEATANWNIFRCSAPRHYITHGKSSMNYYTSKVLERHPYSTQTFVPMGQDARKISYLVIVAPNDPSTGSRLLPDISKIRAFVCKGNQSITYGKGTWHAPMVVIDEYVPYIDYAVFIHENGVSEEDCQECYLEPGIQIEYTSEERFKEQAKY